MMCVNPVSPHPFVRYCYVWYNPSVVYYYFIKLIMKKIIAFVLASSPVLAFAQQPLRDINSVAAKATNIGNLIIALAISIAILWIIVNIVRYLIATNGPEKRVEGGKGILWGVVGLFVILSIWGLVAILRNSFKTEDQIPTSEINRTTTLPVPAPVQ